VLVASDGLMDNVHVDEIIEIVRKGPLKDAVFALIELAGERMKKATGGQPSKPDDLSVILFRKPIMEKE
jgi:serine/threonine protein phosphatase PrpC